VVLFSTRFNTRPLGALADNLELPATVFATVSRSLTVNWEGGVAASFSFKNFFCFNSAIFGI